MNVETNYAPIAYEDAKRLIGFRLTTSDGDVLERGDMDWTRFRNTKPSTVDPRVERTLRDPERNVYFHLDIEHFTELHITVETDPELLDDHEDSDVWQFKRRSAFEEWVERNNLILAKTGSTGVSVTRG